MPPIPSQVHGRMSTVYDEVVQEVHFRGKTVRDDINIGRVQPWERMGLKRVRSVCEPETEKDATYIPPGN